VPYATAQTLKAMANLLQDCRVHTQGQGAQRRLGEFDLGGVRGSGLCPVQAGRRLFIMITIRFPDAASKHRALGYLAGCFSFKSFATGEMLVPPDALPALAQEGIAFHVVGPGN
jgi:hypothetical protein